MIRCTAIDDEPIALDIVRNFCQRLGHIELDTFTSPQEAMKHIVATRPDLVLLDVELNSISGIDLAKQMPEETLVIFTTAYAQYAIDGFEVNAIDFLHKPYFFARFERAIRKAEEALKARELAHKAGDIDRTFTLKSDYKNVVVSTRDIVYVESIDNYVKVHFYNGTHIMTKMTLRQMCEMLPPKQFIRIHRSYVVALRCVDSYTATEVVIQHTGQRLPIGKTYAAEAFEKLP